MRPKRYQAGKQIAELKKYDEVVHHYADKRIELDLDDGVKVNYASLGSYWQAVGTRWEEIWNGNT